MLVPSLTYKERLENLGLPSLKKENKNDMTAVLKVIMKADKIDQDIFVWDRKGTRGHK